MVNLCEHVTGARPSKDLTLSQALSGTSNDPCVGKFLEFRVVRPLSAPDKSKIPLQMIANPNLSNVPVVRQRVFTFGRSASNPSPHADTSFFGPWGITTDGGLDLDADYGRVSAAPKAGTREIWTLVNEGSGWDHPVHIHFEEGQVLERNGSAANVPAWEKGRKDVYRLRPAQSIKITMQFRDWGVHGALPQHCP